MPPEKNSVVQVKYTNQRNDGHPCTGVAYTRFSSVQERSWAGKSMLLMQNKDGKLFQLLTIAQDASLAFSGSNQARKGRLVNALAVRGDERRDTLR